MLFRLATCSKNARIYYVRKQQFNTEHVMLSAVLCAHKQLRIHILDEAFWSALRKKSLLHCLVLMKKSKGGPSDPILGRLLYPGADLSRADAEEETATGERTERHAGAGAAR